VNSAAGGAVHTGDVCFEEDGHEAHNGLELNAVGKAASWLRLSFSSLAMNAVSSDTSTPAFDNKQVINVPRLHTNAFADIAVPHWRGLYLMPGWTYSSRKEATRDDVVSVPSVNLFQYGCALTHREATMAVSRCAIYADNIANKRYWSDTGASYGDTFLWLGAPATVRLSAHYFILSKQMLTTHTTAHAHGLDGRLVEPDWPPLSLHEVQGVLPTTGHRLKNPSRLSLPVRARFQQPV